MRFIKNWPKSLNRYLDELPRPVLGPSAPCQGFGSSAGEEKSMSRDWLSQLWILEKRKKNVMRRKKQQSLRPDQAGNTLTSFQLPSVMSFLSRLAPAERGAPEERTVKESPVRRHGVGFLSPGSLEEARIEPLLARENLLITRDVEWANIMFAFEQESRYVIVDPCCPQSPVGSIREQSNVIYRQLLRSRRPFVAHVTDALGNEIFRVRRPFWLINSTIYAEVDGKEVGVVHRRWHLWRRIYDLYLGDKQFAVVENPGFWNWTFTLKDDSGDVLAQIDRDWRGLGLELFTDAGQYVIRFGEGDSLSKLDLASVSPIPKLEVARPLTLSERALAVALAVSLDTDYFSRHGGWGFPILLVGE